MTTPRAILTVFLCTIAATASAQPSDADIDAAIKQGLKAKESASIRIDQNIPSLRHRVDFYAVTIEGPLNRVVNAAREARRTYRTFTRADVTAEMLANQLTVTTIPKKPEEIQHPHPPVDRLVLLTRADPPPVIQPITSVPIPVQWTNGFGARVEGMGMFATFPMPEAGAEFDVVVVTTRGEVRMPVTRKHLEKLR